MSTNQPKNSGAAAPDPSFHAVRLEPEKCAGCSLCVESCPTEAIFVERGLAFIDPERCIDCGECVRVCPRGAKTAVSDCLSMIEGYRRTVAIPAPALYGQFDEAQSVDGILAGLIELGFDEVFEVSEAIELIAGATEALLAELRDGDSPLPLISSACPAVVRIVQLRFPALIPHVVALIPPMEVAARMVKETMHRGEEGLGVFFITPCAGKVSVTRAPLGYGKSAIDGVIGFKDIYPPLKAILSSRASRPDSPAPGRGFPYEAGEASGDGRSMKVEGIAKVIETFEALERGELAEIRYIEALACPAGCVGGPLSVEDPFVARERISRRELTVPRRPRGVAPIELLSPLDWSEPIRPPAFSPRRQPAAPADSSFPSFRASCSGRPLP
ncbi:MAG TPA: [Fe-Fe] hydrogenase large subunit C-terminal domain-containing protein [Rectinemataceae bacterium]|nr:[Fe-Fe] hydrogenase large subunit C-terminal domain-containing protein [Rectinemataceae bacterium]